MADIVNGRCHNDKALVESPPLFQNGKLVIQMHHIGWLVCGVFTVAATVITFWLMNKHLQWYTNKAEQRYIIRILLMVPLYAVISTASFLFWNHSTPLLLLRDCYESIVLTSFFYLLLLYISPDTEEQKEVFRKNGLSHLNDCLRIAKGEPPKKWMLPLGGVKAKPQDGLYFLQMMKWGVLQYCVVRPGTTLAAVILDYVGLYCEDSWSPGWGHIYLTVIVSISVSVAMYCLIQLYSSVSTFLSPKQPLLKLFAIKAVVFLTFWQATMLSMLATFGLVKDTQYMTAENINIGIGAVIETVEMTLFALLHLKAFSYHPYVVASLRTKRIPALLHAFNFMETYRELHSGTIYMWHRMRGRETDVMARRQAALEGVFGKSRIAIQGRVRSLTSNEKNKKSAFEKEELAVEVAVEQTVHLGGERLWLGLGDNHEYGQSYHFKGRREKSLGLEEQVERELAKRGYGRHQPSNIQRSDIGYDLLDVPVVHEEPVEYTHRRKTSWWRNAYNRISHSEPTATSTPMPETLHPIEERPNGLRSTRAPAKGLSSIDLMAQTYDDPPPPTSIRKYRETKSRTPNDNATKPLLSPSLSQFPPTPATSMFPRPSNEVRRPGTETCQDTNIAPMQSVASLPSVSSRTDSFLGRAFPPNSDASRSTEVIVGGDVSSQSHHAHLQLVSVPEVVPGIEHKAIKRKPVRYSAPPVPSSLPMAARIEENPVAVVAKLQSPGHRNKEANWTMSQRSYTPDRVVEENRAPMYNSPPLSSPNRYVPRRDQIVLPALLAPVASSSSPSPPPPGLSSPRQPAPRNRSEGPSHISPRHLGPSSPSYLASQAYFNGTKPPRRSERTNKRRYSHTFTQAPSPSTDCHRPRQSSHRTTVPSQACTSPIVLDPPHRLRNFP
ncbi:organic solute transporter Ostalpha-domain-containing protein [Cytidiella melzeri]|nr:organic solute transporter Ostalpha-domain-containing protein [Cytidiella melzeri]